MMEVIGTLMAKGGMVLHGEQEFVYHRPLVVGERLQNEGVVATSTRRRRATDDDLHGHRGHLPRRRRQAGADLDR